MKSITHGRLPKGYSARSLEKSVIAALVSVAFNFRVFNIMQYGREANVINISERKSRYGKRHSICKSSTRIVLSSSIRL
jgi:hypothetical protein